LSVIDDGAGFDPRAIDKNQSYGLGGLKERVALVGGKVEIRSSGNPGRTARLSRKPLIGTTIKVTVPKNLYE
jgi:signal transduction histidine kinase